MADEDMIYNRHIYIITHTAHVMLCNVMYSIFAFFFFLVACCILQTVYGYVMLCIPYTPLK